MEKELCHYIASCFSNGIRHFPPLHPDSVISLGEEAKEWMYEHVVKMMTFLAKQGKTKQDSTRQDKIILLGIWLDEIRYDKISIQNVTWIKPENTGYITGILAHAFYLF